MERIKKEPVITVAATLSLLGAVILLLLEFNVINWTPEQVRLVLSVAAIALPIIAAVISRFFVTSVYDPRDRDGYPLVRK